MSKFARDGSGRSTAVKRTEAVVMKEILHREQEYDEADRKDRAAAEALCRADEAEAAAITSYVKAKRCVISCQKVKHESAARYTAIANVLTRLDRELERLREK